MADIQAQIQDTNHKRFLQHLEKSASAVWFVAMWFWGKGYTVTMPFITMASGHEQWRDHADNGDLEVLIGNERKRVEVKHLGVCFTGREDWPFPDFIVCAKHSFDNAQPKPDYYIVLSNDKEAMGIVDTSYASEWTTSRRTDSRYKGIDQDFYVCRPDRVIWRKANE